MQLGPCKIKLEKNASGTKLVIEGWAAILATFLLAIVAAIWVLDLPVAKFAHTSYIENETQPAN